MTQIDTLSISRLRQNLASALNQVSPDNPLTILKHDQPRAVIVEYQHYQTLIKSHQDLADILEAKTALSEPTNELKSYIRHRWPKGLNTK